ncbi:MAG: SulP family inorganic anion transporter [Desulfobacteraceae bacterium]|jgi:MFS superfamily sulfate permease-like transporter|nr:SulP family inorganic anion transporter [Desulfobacteraceae bacterium]
MIKKILSYFDWPEGYGRRSLKTDIVAGLTVALVLIPQSMAYAELAGLPAYYGLYASFLPPMIAALFGSSRQLATGPVAVVSLLTAITLEPLATAGSQQYIAYAILLALLVGVFQFSLGVLKLGLVVNFISHPVVNGFSNAAALIIATAQLPKLFGIHIDRVSHHYELIYRVFVTAAHYTHWPTLFMGVLAFVIMYGLKFVSPRLPNVLAAVAVTTILSWSLGFERNLVVDIGAIRSEDVKQALVKINHTIDAITQMTAARAELIQKLNANKNRLDPHANLDIRHAAERLALRIEQAREDAADFRKQISSYLLAGIRENDGALAFYGVDEIADSQKGDGRVWRIKAGNSPLQSSRLQMIGGGEVVGHIPRGLPSFSLPRIDYHIILDLLPFVVIISLLGFMEAISVAKAMAAKTGQRLDPNRELIGQGLANICGAVTKSYPISGSFSRSAVNLQAGAVSGLSSVFTSLTVVVVLMVFTPLFYHLPQSVLAAIIMMAVVGLVNVKGFIHAWQAQWYDGAISIITFIATLVFAPHLDRGILIGAGLSILVFLYKSMRPKVVDLSLDVDRTLHDAVASGLEQCRYIDVVRFDGPLFFANASYLEDQIRNRRRSKKELKHIIISAGSINDIDSSGEEALSLSVDRVRSAGIDLSLSGVNRAVMQVLNRTHLIVKIGEDHVYPTIENAINAVHEMTHRGGKEKDCPLTTVCRISRASQKRNS